MKNENWQEEFDKLPMDYPTHCWKCRKTILDFIDELLKSQKESLLEKIEKLKCDGLMKDLPEMREYNHALELVLSLIKEE